MIVATYAWSSSQVTFKSWVLAGHALSAPARWSALVLTLPPGQGAWPGPWNPLPVPWNEAHLI